MCLYVYKYVYVAMYVYVCCVFSLTGVRFRSDSSTAPESNGFITFVVELVGSSDSSLTVQAFSEETIPPQARGILVTFLLYMIRFIHLQEGVWITVIQLLILLLKLVTLQKL